MNTAQTKFLNGKLKNEIIVGIHHLISDVSLSDGGEDSGPSPHDLLAASLAACTGLTIRMYSQRKNFPLTDAIVKVEITKTPEKTLFSRTIELKGNLDQAQKERIIDIAGHCPIHKVLSGKIEIETKLL
jgi:putative redox protein